MENRVTKPKTYFEQIPLNAALKAAEQVQMRPVPCAICGKPVALENCNIDEEGIPVHAACYFRKVSRTKPARA